MSIIKSIKRKHKGGFIFDHHLYMTVLSFCLIAIALMTAKYVDSPDVWFQRIGSIITISTVIFEIKLINRFNKFSRQRDHYQTMVLLQGHLPNAGITLIDEEKKSMRQATKADVERMESSWSKREALSQVVIFVNFAVGTAIWGYGDLIYSLFIN